MKPGEDGKDVPEFLFQSRTPEAAARQLAMVLAWLTECELATLEGISTRKSTPKHELARHEAICRDAIRHCAELNVAPKGFGMQTLPRLKKELAKRRAKGAEIERPDRDVLDSHTA